MKLRVELDKRTLHEFLKNTGRTINGEAVALAMRACLMREGRFDYQEVTVET
jgi:hypothetical protein